MKFRGSREMEQLRIGLRRSPNLTHNDVDKIWGKFQCQRLLLHINFKMDRKYLSSLHAQYGTPRKSDPPKSSTTPVVVPPSPFDPAATPSTISGMPSVMKDLNNNPPSAMTIAIAIGLLGLLAGYFLGQGSSIGLFGASGNPTAKSGGRKKGKKSWPNSYDVKIHEDSSSEDVAGVGTGETESEEEEDLEDSENQQEVKGFEGSGEEVKLVLCVRTDLGMTKGMFCSEELLWNGRALIGVYRQARLRHKRHTLRWHATSTSRLRRRQHRY